MNKGFTSIILIAIIFLLSLLLLKCERNIISVFRVISNYKQILLNSFQNTITIDRYSQSNCQGVAPELCMLSSHLNKKLFNYNAIFDNFHPCQQTIPANPNFIINNVAYSARSFVSSQTCTERSEKYPIQENIYISAQSELLDNKLISAGFIFIDAELSLTQNTKIIAGGDIYLKKITALTPIQVQVHSATGNVQIAEKSASIIIANLDEAFEISKYIYAVFK